MRIPHLRFTVRRLMLAVAVLGLLFGAEIVRRRREHSLARYKYHVEQENRMRQLLGGGWITEKDESGKRKIVRIGRSLERETVQRRLTYHLLMGDRYRRATRYPWLGVEPDSPEPEWIRALISPDP